jgi:hypothetical protein
MSDVRQLLTDALTGMVGELGAKTKRGDAEIAADELLSLPGIAIVELPEQPWDDPFAVAVVPHSTDLILIWEGRPIGAVTVPYARTSSAALLAAADKAEKTL